MNDELRLASKRFSGLTQRRPGVALGLWGEPGVGKTHAALALLRAFPGRSWTVHATQTLASVASLLPRPKKPTLWLERTLERLARGEQAEAAMGAQTLAALLSATAPVVLHVEDLHETSEEGLAFWTQVAAIVSRTRSVGLVVTGRAAPPAGFEALRLAPLSREDSGALLEAEVGAALPGEALAWVFERARGNPLFTLEFFRLLSRQGFAWNDGHRWRWRVPEREVMPSTVEAVIERMLRDATHTPALEQAVQAKAVLGLDASEALWAEVSGLSSADLAQAKTELERQGVLSQGEFAHPLYPEVVVQNLTPPLRQSFAQRAVQMLEDNPGDAARYFSAAGFEAAEALGWLERAARATREAGNPVQAARLQARAVEYAYGEQKARMAVEAARELHEFDLNEAIRLTEIALSIQPEEFEILEMLATYSAQAGHYTEAKRLLERCSPEDRAHLRGFSLELRVLQCLNDAALVVERWEARPEMHALVAPGTIKDIAFSKTQLGDSAGALQVASQALNQAELTVEQRVDLLQSCAYACYASSNYGLADRYCSEAIQLLRDHGQAHRTGALLFNRSATRQSLARYLEAVTDATEARALAAEGRHPRFYANAQLSLGAAQIELGEYEKAEEVLLEMLAYYRQAGLVHWQIDCELKLSELYLQWVSPYCGVLAQKHAETALTLARSIKNPRYIYSVLPSAALVQAHFGQPQRALELAEEAHSMSNQFGAGQMHAIFWSRAAALEALGQAGPALAEAQLALKCAEQAEAYLHAHKIGLEVARLTDDIELARTHLEWFEERGLMDGVYLAHRYFPELAEDTSSSPQPESLLRLEVLGPMQLRQEGVSTPLRGGKRKELLALLLEARLRGRGEVTALALCDALYPLEPEEAALGALRAAVFKLRSSLGATLVVTTPNGYALGSVASDAEAFLQGGDTNLWRGPYLGDVALEGRDENVSDALGRALEARIEVLLEANAAVDLEEAVRLGQLLVRAEPYDLGALTLACRALETRGNHKALERLYSEARTRMLEVGETLPKTSAAFLETHFGAGVARVGAEVSR